MKTTVRGSKSMTTQVLTTLMLLLIVGFSVIAQTTSRTEVQALADKCAKLDANKAALTKEKNGLLDEEKRLQQEDNDLKREVTRLRNSKLDFKMDADALQQDINKYNAECGGSHPRSVHESLRPKCEPWGARIDTKNADLDKKAGELTAAQNNVYSRQVNLTRDTLNWTQKTKETDAKISEGSAKLEEAQSKAIAEALKDLRMRKDAGDACKAIKNLEQLSCCNSVVWDGTDPHRCGVENVYQVFKKGGVFGTPVVVPGKRPT